MIHIRTDILPSAGGNLFRNEHYALRSVSPVASERPPPPESVWDAWNFESWRSAMTILLADIVDGSVVDVLSGDRPEYLVSDDLSWLDDAILKAKGIQVDSKDLLAGRIRSRFDSLRAVHATRTNEVRRFYEQGLIPLDIDSANAALRATFLSNAFPEVSKEDLENAIKAVGGELREGRVFFEANEKMLLKFGGHYLLYGSEYATAVAAHIRGPRDYRQELRKIGRPTMFLCDVPLPLVREGTLREFAGSALQRLFEHLLGVPDVGEWTYRGGGFSIREALPPACIVGHYHPEGTRDPFLKLTTS